MGYVENLRQLVGHQPLILNGSLVIFLNEHKQVLLQERKSPLGYWGLVGGLMELGESTEEAARREVLEETGMTLSSVELFNIFSGRDFFVRVAENGDEFYVVTTVYLAKDFSGEPVVNDNESLSFKWFNFDEIPFAKIVKAQRLILKEMVAKLG